MSIYRAKPILEKLSDNRIICGRSCYSCGMQGWRRNMEDGHASSELPAGIGLFGVFDGHGGEEVAMFISRHIAGALSGLQRGYDPAVELRGAFLGLEAMMQSPDGAAELSQCIHGKKKSRGSVHKMRVMEYQRLHEGEGLDLKQVEGIIVAQNVGCTVVAIRNSPSRLILHRDCCMIAWPDMA